VKAGDLVSIYKDLGRWKEAEEMEVQVVEISSGGLGSEHPSTLTRMGGLATTYIHQARWKEAEKILLRVIQSLMRLGGEHPDILPNMSNLALAYRGQELLEEAEALQVQVIGTLKERLGGEHPDTLAGIGNFESTFLVSRAVEGGRRAAGASTGDMLEGTGCGARSHDDYAEPSGVDKEVSGPGC
jgi:hypothetical protein